MPVLSPLPPVEALSESEGELQPGQPSDTKSIPKAAAKQKPKPKASEAVPKNKAHVKAKAKVKAKPAAKKPPKSTASAEMGEPEVGSHAHGSEPGESVVPSSKKKAMKRPAAAPQSSSVLKRPATSVVPGLDVSQPYYDCRSQKWGLRICGKQSILVGGKGFDREKTREITVACREHLLKGDSLEQVKEMKDAMLAALGTDKGAPGKDVSKKDEDDDEQNDAEAAAAAVPEDSVEVVAAECRSPEEDFKTEEAGKEEGEEEAPELDVEVADVNQSEAAPDID